MLRRLILLLAVAALGLTAHAASASARPAVHCPFFGNVDSKTSGISCADAERFIDEFPSRCLKHAQCTVHGYTCRRVSPAPHDVRGSFQETCIDGDRKIVFTSAP